MTITFQGLKGVCIMHKESPSLKKLKDYYCIICGRKKVSEPCFLCGGKESMNEIQKLLIENGIDLNYLKEKHRYMSELY